MRLGVRDLAAVGGVVAVLGLAHLGALYVLHKRAGHPEHMARTIDVRHVMQGVYAQLDQRLGQLEAALPSLQASLSAAGVCAEAITDQLSQRDEWQRQITRTLDAQADAMAVIARRACSEGGS